MKRAVSLMVCLTVLIVISGCSGSGSGAPSGAVMTLTPSDKITVENASSTIESASQTFHVAVKDSKATNAPGVRDVTFSISFGFIIPPDARIYPDAAGVVTLCDGTRITGTPVVRTTDNQGNADVCILYKSGGGLAYSGSLVVASGDQSPSVSLEVTSKPQALAVSPSSQTVPAGSTAQYTIVGGIPPYAVSANPSSILPPAPSTVNQSGGTFSVTVPLSVPDGTSVIYTVTDAVGSQVAATLTVGPPSSQPEVLPKSVNVLPSGTAQFTIINGFPPYTISAGDASLVLSTNTVLTSGGTFSVTVPVTVQPGAITLTVRDSADSTVDATLNVVAPPVLVLSPTFVSVTAGGSAKFSITGGIPPYTVVTSDASVTASPSTVLKSGGTFSLSVPSSTPTESVTVTVVDALGSQASSTVSVTGITPLPLTISPSSTVVSSAAGGSPGFIITGGTPPYTVVSSNASSAFFGTPGTGSTSVSSSGGSFTATVPPGTVAGTVTLTVSDSASGNTAATITIQ